MENTTTLTPETEELEIEEVYPIVYNMWVTITNSTVTIKQTGRPPNPPPPPGGG